MTYATLLFFIALASGPGRTKQPMIRPPVAVRSSIEWFETASEQMDLRAPGAAPFRMKVKFQALPGNEFLSPKEKPQIIAGDGTYEETWIGPHQWRREITLASYHAVEVESSAGRKLQASSDYEPSRVLMLLNALLEPIPRNFSSREFAREGASGWRIQAIEAGDQQMVRLSKNYGNSQTEMTDAFYLLPKGALLMRNELGLVTSWDHQAIFAGKLFARHLAIRAGVDRDLLTADVSVEPASISNLALFDLPGKVAEPGMTLRPLLPFEVKMPVEEGFFFSSYTAGGVFSFHRVFDRHGREREVEIITAADLSNAGVILNSYKAEHLSIPKIDGSPCEVGSMTYQM